MLRKFYTGLLVLLMLLVSFNCKKKSQIKGIELDVSFSEEKLSDNLMTDMKLTWRITEQFIPMSQDLNIFVHFWDGNNLLLQADFFPETTTSTWELNNEYTFSQRIYIPAFIDEFDPDFKGEEILRLAVGFSSPYDTTGESKQEILEKKLKIFPPPLDTPEVIYEEGWHDQEINPESYLKQWRWTSKTANCIVDNPHRDALLVIRGGVNLEANENQKIIFKINDLILDEFIPEQSSFEKSYNLKKELMGERDEFYLTISTDKAFIPAKVFPDSTDERELGMQISFIYFH